MIEKKNAIVTKSYPVSELASPSWIPSIFFVGGTFGPLQGQVKTRDFPEAINAKRHYFYFPYKVLGIIGTKRLRQPFWIMIWDL